MIRVTELCKSFEGFPALDGASFTVPEGSVTGLVGPNGAGKTTLLRHIAGIYRQDSGSVLVMGEPVYENKRVKKNIVFIPDEIYSFPGWNGEDMKKFYAGLYPDFDGGLYDRLGEAFPALTPKKSIARMSRGMKKQTAFRLAISAKPKVLLLDEPVDGLDPIMRKTVWSILLREIAEQGLTVLISSHNLRELEDVCDRVVIMNKGKVFLESAADDLQKNIFKVQAAYDGEIPEFGGMEILSRHISGRVVELVIRGDEAETMPVLESTKPLFIERIPMTLEEIFINELGGEYSEIRDILL